MLSPLAAAGSQRIQPTPELGAVGSDVVVTVTSREGEPLRGLEVRARPLGADDIDLGRTDERGSVRFRPAAPGRYQLRARLPERELVLIAPYEVLPPRRHWLWALVCIPLGLALLWLNLRRWRGSAGAGDEPIRGPSPPGP